jgi:hypothetical protein
MQVFSGRNLRAHGGTVFIYQVKYQVLVVDR